MEIIDKTIKIWEKRVLVKDKLFALIPSKEDINCISSNVYAFFFPNHGWTAVDLGGQKYSDALISELPEGIERVLLTHAHADHIGDLDLFKGKRIYLSKEELRSFYEDSKNALHTGFRWAMRQIQSAYSGIKEIKNISKKFYRVGGQADKIAKHPEKYKLRKVETELNDDFTSKQLETLDDLDILKKEQIGYMQFPGHTQGGMVYAIKLEENEAPYVFVGDAFAPFDGPTGTKNAKKPFTLSQIVRKLRNTKKILLGHDSDYFANKEISE